MIANESRCGDRVAVFTTSWDDGHILDKRLADLLVKYDLAATFYVPLDVQWPRLSDHDLRELAFRFEIGAHTIHHPELSDLPDSVARQEIVQSKERLENLLGVPCRMFCFPRGRYQRRHLRFVREAGYLGGRTVELFSTALPQLRNETLVMPTTVHAAVRSHLHYWKNLGRRMAVKNLPNYYCFCFRRNWLEAVQRLVERTLNYGGVFHLWGHSWEIEELQLWCELEQVFRLMSAYRKSARIATNGDVCSYVHSGGRTTAFDTMSA